MKSVITKITIPVIIVFAGLVLVTSCKKETTVTPAAGKVDPGKGAGGQVVTLTGSNLKDVQSIVFDLGNIPVAFNPNFNTNEAVIFRVPSDANVGDQHIVFINAAGYQFSVPFTVLAVPSVTSAFPAEWEAGSNITLTGNYFSTVDHVSLDGTSDTAIIVSKTATKLVIKMPASEAKTAKLSIRNDAGASSTSITFLNMDKQLKLFTEGLGSGMQNWSWCAATNSTDVAVSGTTSFKAVYSKGGGQGLSFHYDFDIKTSDYQVLSFWVKGGSDDNEIQVNPDAVKVGATDLKKLIVVPSDVWTYFEIPMSGNFDGVTCQRFNFQVTNNGPKNSDQTLYFDNVLLVK
jgi:hypothetical protein